MKEHYLKCQGENETYKMFYREWGDSNNPKVLFCVHGFTRNSQDFSYLAEALKDKYRVICPDVVGRGKSDWLDDKTKYDYTTYVRDMIHLVSHLKPETLDWIGTSMGGNIGMIISGTNKHLIRKLVLNDVGPKVTKDVVQRLQDQFEEVQIFKNLEDAEEHLRDIYHSFGKLTVQEWRKITKDSFMQLDDGTYVRNYDPGITHNLKQLEAMDVEIWEIWDNINCPVMSVRGVNSDVLTSEILWEMQMRGPDVVVLDVPETGHTPTLLNDSQIAKIRQWLSMD
jgi:pimeloyl-ACP methyl ester carboxylesterase